MAQLSGRRKSLFYSEQDDSLSTNLSTVALDDSDMVALKTAFDKQILSGHPMYIEEQEDIDSIRWADINDEAKRSLKRRPSYISSLEVYSYDQISRKRAEYVNGSFQSAKHNVKNDINEWFLYPKPLPKFWRFDRDKRFETPIGSNHEFNEVGGTFRPDSGFFGADEDPTLYTGEFFDIDHYKFEFNKHVKPLQSSEKFDYDKFVDSVPPISGYLRDFEATFNFLTSSHLEPIASKRIDYLVNKFELFQHLNGNSEIAENKKVSHRDFYNIRKVDQNHLLSGCVSQRQLNEFIWEKLNSEAERIVYKDSNGNEVTLRQLFCHGKNAKNNEEADIGLRAVDDTFLEWYQTTYLPNYHLTGCIPASMSNKEEMYFMIARTFLEFDNFIDGEYFALLIIKHVIHNLERSKYQIAQLSIDFQFTESWWSNFAKWIVRWRLVSYNIRWNLRISRCYSKVFSTGQVPNFQAFLDRLFQPLLNAEAENNIELQFVLSTLCCFDMVNHMEDDYTWTSFSNPIQEKPLHWVAKGDNPPISLYMYYLNRYIAELNKQRYERHQNTFALRNSCPQKGNRVSQFLPKANTTEHVEALISNLLLCQGGLLHAEPLWNSSPAMVYAFYLLQIPLVLSPLSSVSPYQSMVKRQLFDDHQTRTRDVTIQRQGTYTQNPFFQMHKAGLLVTLSTNSVLLNSSYTSEPIIEEFSVAASIYKLNSADLCEFLRNSIVSSGYEGFYKRHWIGVTTGRTSFFKDDIGGIDLWYDIDTETRYRHNVPDMRRTYRRDTFKSEWEFVRMGTVYTAESFPEF
ncbi:LAMI_0H11606g1_1 [Lachancea mirantina]|uniref:LAMI_0H11606g1_1 n=1 Tax=Lachancea mirantina TaxID=1230905 RepID=A0A1G4KH34_9SACH|nr:LAMI_0H11606g1_1 [Lachancea mirantina]